MAIRITHIRIPSNGTGTESITDYQWLEESSGKVGYNSKATLVDWVDQASNSAYVRSDVSHVPVGVARPKFGAPYLRTYANGIWTDNLLSLPRF